MLADRLRPVLPRRWVIWLGLVPVLLLLGAGSIWHPDDSEPVLPPHVVELRHAVAWPGVRQGGEASAVAVELPALGPSLPLDEQGRALVSLRFDWPQELPPQTLLGAYLPGSCGSIDVDLNGTALLRDARPGDARAQLCPHPMLIPLPSTLLYKRGNRLDIHLHGLRLAKTSSARRAAYLAPPWIGPLATLQQQQAVAEMVHVGLPRLIHFGLLVLGGIVLLLSRAGHNVTLLRLYGLLVLVWSAALGLIVWAAPPWLPASWFDVLLVSLWTPTVALTIRLLLTLCGRACRWLFRLLALQGIVIPLGMVLLPADMSFIWAISSAVILVAQGMAVFVFYLTDRWRQRREEFWFGLAAWALVVAAWTLDALSTPSGLPPLLTVAWIAGSPFGWAAMAVVTGVRIVSGLNRALVAAEASRALLQTRVLDVTAVVERNFAQLAEMRIAQMTEKERKRIASDLHDDLGAKLLTIVHTCEDERIATLGREALDEMRLAVRGLSSKPMPVGDAVADWRAEIVMRLGKTKIRLEWHSSGEFDGQALNARAYVQITRILREAVSNILKHSQATRCSIRLNATANEFNIVVKDDGRGLAEGAEQAMGAGHGLASMKQRAQQLDGSCEITSLPGSGTEIKLSFPLREDRSAMPDRASG
ncbi:sensor histidine kinase [Piscinibacter sakaiensis]|uniref:sensor histidine kinase n=1 Tax=Piscinibacter sakaiensis TaxID=1547922 RepID=UPI003AAE93CA